MTTMGQAPDAGAEHDGTESGAPIAPPHAQPAPAGAEHDDTERGARIQPAPTGGAAPGGEGYLDEEIDSDEEWRDGLLTVTTMVAPRGRLLGRRADARLLLTIGGWQYHILKFASATGTARAKPHEATLTMWLGNALCRACGKAGLAYSAPAANEPAAFGIEYIAPILRPGRAIPMFGRSFAAALSPRASNALLTLADRPQRVSRLVYDWLLDDLRCLEEVYYHARYS